MAVTNSAGSDTLQIVPIKRLRLVPSNTGKPKATNLSKCANNSRFSCLRLPKPMPGSMRIFFFECPIEWLMQFALIKC